MNQRRDGAGGILRSTLKAKESKIDSYRFTMCIYIYYNYIIYI